MIIIFKISNYFFKIFSRSYFLIFGCILSVYFLTATYTSHVIRDNSGLANYIKTQEYSLIAMILACCGSIIFALDLKENQIKHLITNQFKYFMSICLAAIKLSFFLGLIPLSYILMYIVTHKNLNMIYILNCLIEFIFTYLYAVSMLAILTTIICFLFKRTGIRLLVFTPIFFLTSAFAGNSISSYSKLKIIIFNILNVQDDFEFIKNDINELKLSEPQLQEIEDKKEIIIAPIFDSTQQLIQVIDGVLVIVNL